MTPRVLNVARVATEFPIEAKCSVAASSMAMSDRHRWSAKTVAQRYGVRQRMGVTSNPFNARAHRRQTEPGRGRVITELIRMSKAAGVMVLLVACTSIPARADCPDGRCPNGSILEEKTDVYGPP